MEKFKTYSLMFEEFASRLCMNCTHTGDFVDYGKKPSELTRDICLLKLDPFTTDDEDCPYFEEVQA